MPNGGNNSDGNPFRKSKWHKQTNRENTLKLKFEKYLRPNVKLYYFFDNVPLLPIQAAVDKVSGSLRAHQIVELAE